MACKTLLAFFHVRSRLLDFLPGGHPSHAYFSPPSRNKYMVKSHLTLIGFRASGVPISRNSHLTIKTNNASKSSKNLMNLKSCPV